MLYEGRMLVKRLLRRRKLRFRCAMASMGGVGSTALARHIGSISDKTDKEHAYSPAVYDNYSRLRLGYMAGNPYNALLSIFRRGYQHMHAAAMHANSGTTPADLRGVSLEGYLDRGVDEFFIERQFDNWVHNPKPKHPTIVIRYESLSENIEAVLDFFACRHAFAVETRKSSWLQQPPHIRRGLERMYGNLNEKIERLPGMRILIPQDGAGRGEPLRAFASGT